MRSIHSSTPGQLKGLLFASGAVASLAWPGSAMASEGGASFYLLGSGGPGAAEMPALTGVFFDNTLHIYDGSAQASAGSWSAAISSPASKRP